MKTTIKNNFAYPEVVEASKSGGRRDAISVDNAIIQSISRNRHNGFVTISYQMIGRNPMNGQYLVTLVTGRNTRIKDQFGKVIGLRGLREGMVVNARFSPAMTKSMPPQSTAYQITIVMQNEASIMDEGRILEIEFGRGYDYLLTGLEDNIYSQMRYTIGNSTLIRDQRGNPISIRALRPGQLVRIERASFQTMSIPPQTPALTVQIIAQ